MCSCVIISLTALYRIHASPVTLKIALICSLIKFGAFCLLLLEIKIIKSKHSVIFVLLDGSFFNIQQMDSVKFFFISTVNHPLCGFL